jgi:macrophage erythroblast attacher
MCKSRLEHLNDYAKEGKLTAPAVQAWKRKRTDRMLVDHCLRSGFYDTAVQLAKDADIEQLVDIDVFMVSRRVEESLSNKDTGPCLSWCYENKSKLRKLKSTLEFNVHIQDFIELVRSGKRMEAVSYARKHLSSAEPHLLGEVQSAMCLLAFSHDTECPRYKKLFDQSRWKGLVTQFRQDNFALHQLNGRSLLSVTLQAGLSALKTPQCYQESHQNLDCPVCIKPLNELAKPLPFAHCMQSRLLCHASGMRMNEHNPPMVLPNGYVYGHNALVAMAASNNGEITCPRTKDKYQLKDAEKVYIM